MSDHDNSGMTVLIVEDDEGTAELERRALMRSGMHVRTVTRVDDAIAVLSAETFSAILLDYNLPGGDPWSIVEIAQARQPRIPVILVTGVGNERIASEAIHRGVDDYVKKADTFWDRLPGILNRVQALADAEQSNARLAAIVESSEDAILSKTLDGTITSWNRSAERIFGYSAAEVLGKSISLLIPESHVEEEIQARARLRSGEGLQHCETTRVCKDGRELDVALTMSPLRGTNGRILGAAVILRDISQQKRTQRQLQASLGEKELLLQEVHHRVKNNLAVVSSLFYLQSTYTQDERLVKVFQDSQRRVRSMALVHETLYGSKNLAEIDFGAYARTLSEELLAAYALGGSRIHMHTEVQAINMSIDLAVPCGLILNELVSNALKHAFPNDGTGNVRVTVELRGDECLLTVADDGVGLPLDLNVDTQGSLGLRLIRSLVRQIRGTFELVPQQSGTTARLTFALGESSGQ
ncbi:MAG: PAS domain S-box protein [bacterium]